MPKDNKQHHCREKGEERPGSQIQRAEQIPFHNERLKPEYPNRRCFIKRNVSKARSLKERHETEQRKTVQKGLS